MLVRCLLRSLYLVEFVAVGGFIHFFIICIFFVSSSSWESLLWCVVGAEKERHIWREKSNIFLFFIIFYMLLPPNNADFTWIINVLYGLGSNERKVWWWDVENNTLYCTTTLFQSRNSSRSTKYRIVLRF